MASGDASAEAGDSRRLVRVGSRKSQLALLQTEEVIRILKSHDSSLDFEIVTYSTKGDEILSTSLSKIGEKSLFTKELDVALQEHQVDFVVHSLKDVSSQFPAGLTLGAICEREWPGDAVLFSPKFPDCSNLQDLPPDSIIGTSSLRRTALVAHHYPHLKAESVRGNLNTRMAKLDAPDSKYSALILANCGIKRMGLDHKIKQTLEPAIWPPAVGQASLAVECRLDDLATLELLSYISSEAATWMAIAERAFMAKLEGGCSVPLGVHCWKSAQTTLTLRGFVYSTGPDKTCLTAESCMDLQAMNGTAEDGDHGHVHGQTFTGIYVPLEKLKAAQNAHELGVSVAENLLAQGAGEVLKAERAKNAAS